MFCLKGADHISYVLVVYFSRASLVSFIECIYFPKKEKDFPVACLVINLWCNFQVWGFFWIYTNRWLWRWDIQGSLYHIARFFPVETCLEREIKRESDQSHFKLSISWTQQKISLQPFLSAQRKPIAAISREAISWAIQILVRTSSHIWVVNLFITGWQRSPIAVGTGSGNLLWTTQFWWQEATYSKEAPCLARKWCPSHSSYSIWEIILYKWCITCFLSYKCGLPFMAPTSKFHHYVTPIYGTYK